MAKAKSLKRQTVFDPMNNVVSSAAQKKDAYPEFDLQPEVATKLDRYFELGTQIKDLEAEKSACYNDVKAEAFEHLVESHFGTGQASNIRIRGHMSSALFMCQNRGAAFGQTEKETFEKTWGKPAAEALLEVDSGKVKINTAVWDANKAVLLKALNATDADGNRIVPESVIQNLFSVSLKVKSNALEHAKKFAEDADALGHLYQDLGLITSLKG